MWICDVEGEDIIPREATWRVLIECESIIVKLHKWAFGFVWTVGRPYTLLYPWNLQNPSKSSVAK
uniref:Uncharacterized protein n=1 Tax=Cucumis melo TaxID=3656 RepID=A0A9I9EB95_CUCME